MFDIEKIPLWGVYTGCVIVVLISIEIGVLIGNITKKVKTKEDEGSVGTIVGATLGLLAFMLAFTFGITASRFETRKELLLEEVNTIETTYLRAGLLSEPHCTQIRGLIIKYIDNRAFKQLYSKKELIKKIKYADELNDQLWLHAQSIASKDLNSDIGALFVESLNNMIDLNNSRITVGSYRIPTIIWIVLIGVTVLSNLAVGYQFSRFGKASWILSAGLALVFSSVILLIADLDRTQSGGLMINQQPMIELKNRLENKNLNK